MSQVVMLQSGVSFRLQPYCSSSSVVRQRVVGIGLRCVKRGVRRPPMPAFMPRQQRLPAALRYLTQYQRLTRHPRGSVSVTTCEQIACYIIHLPSHERAVWTDLLFTQTPAVGPSIRRIMVAYRRLARDQHFRFAAARKHAVVLAIDVLGMVHG